MSSATKCPSWVHCLFCRHAPICRDGFSSPLCERCYKTAKSKAKNDTYRKRARAHGGQRTLTTQQWIATLVASRGACQYCCQQVGYHALTLDHRQPLNLGGDHSAENVTPVCLDCNQRKHDMTYAQWVEREEVRRLAAICALEMRHARLTRRAEVAA